MSSLWGRRGCWQTERKWNTNVSHPVVQSLWCVQGGTIWNVSFAAYWWRAFLRAYCVHVRVMGVDRCHSVCLCFILKFSQLYSMFMLLCVCPPFLCMCVGISANRSVRWDAAESSCHSLMSKLAAFTFHLQSLETVWPEWSYHNVLSHCRVGHLTLHARSRYNAHTQSMQLSWSKSLRPFFNIKI